MNIFINPKNIPSSFKWITMYFTVIARQACLLLRGVTSKTHIPHEKPYVARNKNEIEYKHTPIMRNLFFGIEWTNVTVEMHHAFPRPVFTELYSSRKNRFGSDE